MGYDGGTTTDTASAIGVDSSGNVFVSGYSDGANVTIKYTPAGAEEWVAGTSDINRGGNSFLAVDNAGGVAIAGGVEIRVSMMILLPANSIRRVFRCGLTRYNSPGSPGDDIDYVEAIAMDGAGNVYVSGTSSRNAQLDYDYATVKYAAADGTQLWAKRYGGLGSYEYVKAMALFSDSADGNLYVYVTGESKIAANSSDWDFAVVKYDAADGAESSAETYNNMGSSHSQAVDMEVDDSGNVYVTGVTDIGDNNTNCLTAKYGPNGAVLWESPYSSTAEGESSDSCEAIVVGSSENVFITGTAKTLLGGSDCVTIQYNAETGVEEGTAIYDEENQDTCVDIGTFVDGDDGKEYVYVVGTIGSSSEDYYVVIKYDEDLNQQWKRTFSHHSSFHSYPSALAVNAQGNVYVTGKSENDEGIYPYFVYSTVKYDKAGNEIWYKGYGNIVSLATEAGHEAQAIVVDGSGNVYVTSMSWNSDRSDDATYYDYATVKYDTDGNEVQVATYNGLGQNSSSNDSNDSAHDITVMRMGMCMSPDGARAYPNRHTVLTMSPSSMIRR